MLLNDFYADTVSAPGAGVASPARGPSLTAAGSFAQSASGSVSAEGHPAMWTLALIGLALVLLHTQ